MIIACVQIKVYTVKVMLCIFLSAVHIQVHYLLILVTQTYTKSCAYLTLQRSIVYNKPFGAH